jgi:hypothetical protein
VAFASPPDLKLKKIALAGGKLYVRTYGTLYCFAKKSP